MQSNNFVYAESTFTLNGNYFSSPNQNSPPEPFTEAQPLPVLYTPTSLRNYVWALDGYPYLGFCDKSLFEGELFTMLSGPVEEIHLENDRHGWHLQRDATKSWKQLEQSLRRIAVHAKRWFDDRYPQFPFYLLIEPDIPSKFGYFTTHTTEDAARSGLRDSRDAFVVYAAYLSFISALCQFIGSSERFPSWLPKMDPEFLTAFKKSHLIDFSGERKRTGTIINVLKCGWINVAEVLLRAKVPMWLYWGDRPLMVTPKIAWMMDYRPQLVDLLPPVQNSLSSSTLAPPPYQPQPSTSGVIPSRQHPKVQLPGETFQQYFIRRQKRHEAKMKKESPQEKQLRANREKASAGRQCPGRKGPAVFVWEPDDNGFRVRTLQTRKQVSDVWTRYSATQMVFDSFENEWDCCSIFGEDDPSDDDDDFHFSKGPISTANNVISQNAIVSTSTQPLPHEVSNSMDLHAQSLSSPPPVSTASAIPENAIASTSTSALPLPHEESNPMDVDIQLPPHCPPVSTAIVIPENTIASTSALPPVHEGSTSSKFLPVGTAMELDTPSSPRSWAPVSLAPSYHDRSPRVSPSQDDDNYDRTCRDTQPYGHQRSPRRDSSERYVSHHHRSRDDSSRRLRRRDSRDDSPRRLRRRGSRDDSPRRLHRRDSRDDSPRRLRRRDSRDDSPRRPCHDFQDGGRSLTPRSRSRGPYQSTPNVVITSHPPPPDTIVSGIQSESVEEYLYHRFGFHLDENRYTGVPSSVARTVKFYDWVDVIRSTGCHQLSSSLIHRQPITDFLECLLSTNDPLRDVPAKFWDLSTTNSVSLNLSAGLVRIEPKTFLDGETLYLIHPVDVSRDPSWVLAVDAVTALECVRRRLGPHATDIADFLITRGIHFSTLQRLTLIPGPRTPPRPISTFLGTRPTNYQFNLADFSAYQSICESVLKSEPFCRAALCMGGIVARLAREIIPIRAVLLGPSPSALEGSQKIIVSGGELFCDDKLSETYTDLICGAYEIPTAQRSMYTIKSL